jgi:hypothetical protein
VDHTTFSFTYPDFHHGLLGRGVALSQENINSAFPDIVRLAGSSTVA